MIKDKKKTYILFIFIFFICFLVGMLKLNCYCLGKETTAKVVKTKFIKGVEEITITVDGKNRVVKGYYSDRKYKEGMDYPIHKLGKIITTEIDLTTSFIILIVSVIAEFYLLYKLVIIHIIQQQSSMKEEDI